MLNQFRWRKLLKVELSQTMIRPLVSGRLRSHTRCMTNPKMTTGRVEMVSVEWILQNLSYSVDGFTKVDDYGVPNGEFDFEGMIQNKATDGGFGDLCYTIATNGFRVPIVIDKGQNRGALTQGNGHHRLTAAILMVLDEIPVYWSENDYMAIEHSNTESQLYDTEWAGLENDLADILYRPICGQGVVFGSLRPLVCTHEGTS